MAAATEGPALPAALEYADIGWQVLACTPHSKEPLYRRLPHGVKDATTDPELIRSWFTEDPDANLGVRCGSASGLVVLDVDPRHGGTESLARLIAEHGPLPDTVTCQTGGGGVHFYFAHPGTPLKAWKADGLELRIENLYVLAPPSLHPSGTPYRWSVSPFEMRPAPLPACLLKPKRERPPLSLVVPARSSEEQWAAAALEREISDLATCPAGNRNNRLNEAAFNLGQIVGSGYLSRVIVENRLLDASAANGSLADDGEAKVRGTIRSGLEAGAKEPRYPKEARNGAARTPAAVTPEAAPPGTVEIAEVEYLDLSVEPPPVEWIVNGWLARHDIGIVSAGAGAGKSTLIADLAVAISHERPWCGNLATDVHGPVLYFDEEQSRGTLQRLFRSLGAEHGHNLHVASCQGMRLATAEGRLRLEREINRLEPVLVVLDTVAQVFAGVDLARLEEVSEVFRFLFQMRERYPTAFKMPHHNRKNPRDARGPADPLEQVFGSIGFGGNVDTMWNARRDGTALEVAQSKRRDNERGLLAVRVAYSRDEAGHISLECEGPARLADTMKDRAEIIIVEALAKKRTATTGELKALGKAEGIAEATTKRALEQLVKLQKITSPKRGCYMLSGSVFEADFEQSDFLT